jgi:hypothetical protein
MSDSGLAKKLLLKPGLTFLLLNAPEGYGTSIAAESEQVQYGANKGDGAFDLVQIFVRDREQLQTEFDSAALALKERGVLWVTYPKQSGSITSDLNRDSLSSIVQTKGWQPVTQIAIDETWSALRVRPESEVGT